MKHLRPIIKALFLMLSVGILLTSCADPFDDSAIQSQLNNHEIRIVALESICSQLNIEISSLNKAISDLGNNEIAENSWIIQANGHTLTATAANAATCTEPGNSAYWTCSVCGKRY